MKTAISLEDSDLLIEGVIRKIENKMKNQRGGFRGML